MGKRAVKRDDVKTSEAVSPEDAVLNQLNHPRPMTCIVLEPQQFGGEIAGILSWMTKYRQFGQAEVHRRNLKEILLAPVLVFAKDLTPNDRLQLEEVGISVVDPSQEWYKDIQGGEEFVERVADVGREIPESVASRSEPPMAPVKLEPTAREQLNSFPSGITQEMLVQYFRHLNAS